MASPVYFLMSASLLPALADKKRTTQQLEPCFVRPGNNMKCVFTTLSSDLFDHCLSLVHGMCRLVY